MPWNPDGTRKRSNLYKKSSGFKMKSPLKHTHPHPHTKDRENIKKASIKTQKRWLRTI